MSNTTAVPGGTTNLRLATAGTQNNAKGRGRAGVEAAAALLEAAREGDHEEVRALLASGADPNVEDGEGWTPLMLVTVKGHLDVARELLEAGADVHARNEKGWTALRFAVSMDDAEVLRLLLASGADVNEQDAEGGTALMQAAREKSAESLKLLLAHGADVDIRNRAGETALKIAALHGYQEIVDALRGAGADSPEVFDAGPQALFSDGELRQLMEQVEGLTPLEQAGALSPVAVEEAEESAGQALVPVTAAPPDVLERLTLALEALRSQQQPAPRVSVADAAHKLTLSLPEAAALSGLSRKHIREAMKGGRLASRKIGSGWRIKRADLEAYVRKL